MKKLLGLDNACVVFAILFLESITAIAQVKVLRVLPGQTDPAIETVHGPSIALYDLQAPARNRLVLFFVGTGAKATGSEKMDSVFALMGYHAISLDYEDNVIAVSCAHSLDSNCFDHYRDAIITGAPVSKKIKVNEANSILNRFRKLLIYLVKHDSAGDWEEFTRDSEPLWRRIIVAGHSQGAGHAAYLGKMFDVSRVLMFSGPQDYLDDLDIPAPWEGRKGATPPSRFYAFLNLKDPFNVNHQIASCMKLMELSSPDTAMVVPGKKVCGDSHILINDIPTKHPHSSTILLRFKNVWRYMLTHTDNRN